MLPQRRIREAYVVLFIGLVTTTLSLIWSVYSLIRLESGLEAHRQAAEARKGKPPEEGIPQMLPPGVLAAAEYTREGALVNILLVSGLLCTVIGGLLTIGCCERLRTICEAAKASPRQPGQH